MKNLLILSVLLVIFTTTGVAQTKSDSIKTIMLNMDMAGKQLVKSGNYEYAAISSLIASGAFSSIMFLSSDERYQTACMVGACVSAFSSAVFYISSIEAKRKAGKIMISPTSITVNF